MPAVLAGGPGHALFQTLRRIALARLGRLVPARAARAVPGHLARERAHLGPLLPWCVPAGKRAGCGTATPAKSTSTTPARLQKMGSGVMDAPGGARRADAPSLAREADQNVVTAPVAPNPGEAVREHAALQVLEKLALDEPREPPTVSAVVACSGEEAQEVCLNHLIEERLLRLMAPIVFGQRRRSRTGLALVDAGRRGPHAAPRSVRRAKPSPPCLQLVRPEGGRKPPRPVRGSDIMSGIRTSA
jgi:hypothetical protein